jgi:hypothetical protein
LCAVAPPPAPPPAKSPHPEKWTPFSQPNHTSQRAAVSNGLAGILANAKTSSRARQPVSSRHLSLTPSLHFPYA